MRRSLKNRIRRLIGASRPLGVIYSETYRLPLALGEGGPAPLESRRADDALTYLLDVGAVSEPDVLAPEPVPYSALALVHSEAYLESLHRPEVLARIYAVEPSELVADELLRTIRTAVGGTLSATHHALRRRAATLNLLGGFHHAARDRGAGFCAINDVAVAVASLRAEGFRGRVGILDLDFHPPDGTAECLQGDAAVWLGSISGARWGLMPHVDETVLPEGTSDVAYLAAVDALLARAPVDLELAYVIAGGDILAGDRLGRFNVSLQGVRERDLRVAARLEGLPQVWLPAGGYGPFAWRVVAGTGLVLRFRDLERIPTEYEPLSVRFRQTARTLAPERLGDRGLELSLEDLGPIFGGRTPGPPRFLDYYTPEGLEYALERYQLLPVIRRLGYDSLRVTVDRSGLFDRARVVGRSVASGEAVVLIELEADRRALDGGRFLFVNWMSLRHPRARFSAGRPKLPGQEVPGLGLARELTTILGLMAARLELDGVAFRPSWFHMAYVVRHDARFVDPARQGRFEALLRDLSSLPLLEATRMVADGRVRLGGAPYAWEADYMVMRLDGTVRGPEPQGVAAERERSRFTVGASAP